MSELRFNTLSQPGLRVASADLCWQARWTFVSKNDVLRDAMHFYLTEQEGLQSITACLLHR